MGKIKFKKHKEGIERRLQVRRNEILFDGRRKQQSFPLQLCVS